VAARHIQKLCLKNEGELPKSAFYPLTNGFFFSIIYAAGFAKEMG